MKQQGEQLGKNLDRRTANVKRGKNSTQNANKVIDSPSEATIYRPAIKRAYLSVADPSDQIMGQIEDLIGNNRLIFKENKIAEDRQDKRISTSSEEDGDLILTSSDEFIDTHNQRIDRFLQLQEGNNCDDIVVDERWSPHQQDFTLGKRQRLDDDRGDPIPHSSRQEQPTMKQQATQNRNESAGEKAERIVLEAEKAKARIFKVSGNGNKLKNIDSSYAQAVLIHDDYLAVGSHLDEKLRDKIIQGGYVDLAKLLPRDRLDREEDHRLEQVIRGGQSFFVPMSEKNVTPVNSFNRWEQAFRLYLNVYSRGNPTRVSELIQYIHVIEVANGAFPWENVYRYDKEFRLHMSLHPERNWGIILQQAWSLYMRERPVNGNNASSGSGNTSQGNSQKQGNGNENGNNRMKKICYKFNQGKCTYGFSCKFDHRCGVCAKFGHGAVNCRKIGQHGQEKESGDKRNGNFKR